MTTERHVYGSYRFWVELNGVTEGAFSECAGLQAETEIFEWEEGGWNEYRHRLPGRTKFSNITLKRGIATNELWKWHTEIITGKKVERKLLSIILYGYTGVPEIRWNVEGVLPIKWTGPSFKTGGSETAIETLELVHHGFKRV